MYLEITYKEQDQTLGDDNKQDQTLNVFIFYFNFASILLYFYFLIGANLVLATEVEIPTVFMDDSLPFYLTEMALDASKRPGIFY